MKKTWILGVGIFLFLLAACTLNAEQEQAFSKQKSAYLNAINSGATLTRVSMTYPEFVRYAKQQGPEFFKSTFGSEDSHENNLTNSTIQKTVKKGNKIHILFEVEVQRFDAESTKQQFAGISDDDGANWFFMTYKDYKNKQICPGLKRLL